MCSNAVFHSTRDHEFTSSEIAFHWPGELVNSWSRAVNSSWVHATRVLHFVIKDGLPFASRELVITILWSRVHQLNGMQQKPIDRHVCEQLAQSNYLTAERFEVEVSPMPQLTSSCICTCIFTYLTEYYCRSKVLAYVLVDCLCKQEAMDSSHSVSRKSARSLGFRVVTPVSTGSICLRTAAMSSSSRS